MQGTLSSTMNSTGTTMASAGLANLEAISSTEHAAIVIDPGRTAGAPEIVHVTAHTGSATSATVARGREGTAARAHSSTEEWVHAPTATIDYLPFRPPSARVRRDAAQTLPNSAWDTVTFDTEDWDTDTMWSSTNNDQIFVRTAGKYMACFSGAFANSTGGTVRALGIAKNSTALLDTDESVQVVASQDMLTLGPRLAISHMFSMTTSDYLTAQMFQDRGGTLATSTLLGLQPRFAVLWVSS